MSTQIANILAAKIYAGENAYLWLHSSGDCILWGNEAESENDNGANAINRWQLTKTECAELIKFDVIDCFC